MVEVKITKKFVSWQVGEVVAVSEANAAKLIRNGYAEPLEKPKEEPKPKSKK